MIPTRAATRAFAALQNTGFEAPVLSGGSSAYVYNPTNAQWTFNDRSGIQRNGSAWGAANAPEGVQTAFLQGATSAISQSTTLAAGTYVISFQAARRSGQVQPIKISVDGTQIGSLITPASDSFEAYSSASFTVTAGSHTIMLQGTASGGDLSSLVDMIAVISLPAAPTSLSATVVSSTQINLAWTAPSGTVSGYNVYRGTTSGGESTTALNGATLITSTSYSDTTASAGTAYYYTIKAVNGSGSSSVSSEINGLTYTYGADEGQSFTLPGTCDVAYGANGSYYYKYGQTGTITFDNVSFGDPISGVAKKGYYKTAALSVTSLTVSSANSASYSVQSNALAVGANPYGDTTDTFTTIPGKYLGSTYLKTANADGNTTGSNLLSFTVNQTTTVYVVYSDSYTTKPGWLNDFTDTGDNIVSSKGTFSVYKKTVSAGALTLGGNSFDGMTNNGMYSVFLSSVL